MVAALDTDRQRFIGACRGACRARDRRAAREEVARLVNARPSEVVFTSGATEANNWVMAAGWETICVSAIEHDSVLAPARACGRQARRAAGSRRAASSTSRRQRRDSRAARERRRRVLASLMMANNETGVIQPVAEAAALGSRGTAL